MEKAATKYENDVKEAGENELIEAVSSRQVVFEKNYKKKWLMLNLTLFTLHLRRHYSKALSIRSNAYSSCFSLNE